MSSWIGLTPTVLVAAAVLVLPGLALTRAAGVRGFWSLAWAPPASVGVIAGSAIVAPRLGLSWGVLPPALATAVLAVVILGARLLLRRRGYDWAGQTPAGERSWLGSLRSDLPVLVAVVAGGVVLAARLAQGIGTPEAFSQTYDNNFHLNVLRWIEDNGNASALGVGQLTAGDGGPVNFYPAAWHGVASLVGTIVPTAVPVQANVITIAVGALVWPLSALALAGVLTPLRRWAVVAAGLALAGFATFPYLLVDFGILYPNFLGYALAPAGLSLVACLVRCTSAPTPSPLAAGLLLIPTIAGVGLAHPSAAMLVVALATPLLVILVVRIGRTGRPTPGAPRVAGTRGRVVSVAVAVVATIALALVYRTLWIAINPGFDPRFWQPYQTVAQAIGEAVTATGMGRPPAFALAIAAAVGAVVIAVRRRPGGWWYLASAVIAGGLFITVTATEPDWVRDTITSVWYNDSNRLAAALPLVIAPLVVVGVLSGADWLRSRLADRVPAGAATAGTVVVLAVLVVGTQGPAVRVAVDSMNASYRVDDDAILVSTDELDLIEELPELVDDDARLAVNPFTGGAMAYALADVDITAPHTLMGFSPDMTEINNTLRDATPGSSVCDAIEREGITHVLDFGSRELHGGDNGFHGIRDLEGSDAVTLVDEIGDARLWEVTACG